LDNRFLDLFELLTEVTKEKASDLHLYRTESGCEIKLRKWGNLHPYKTLPQPETLSLIAQLKLHAQLDIAQTQLPQDGKIETPSSNGSPVTIRVSSIPSAWGEDFALRFFKKSPPKPSLTALGFSEKAAELTHQMLQKKSGLILVTGATGSGKTTTLYTCINLLQHARTHNIVTLEDPIETILPGIRQSQVNPSIGYTFITGLRALLRQDPDIVMIGEIRDQETAKTALEAAYTGHLVLSSLHTPNCETTLLRLQSFDLDPFWVQQSLAGIISQTLVANADKEGLSLKTEIFEPNATIPLTGKWTPDHAKNYIGWGH
jgi:type II secretory ATPase GspE/PulE/Tfp pilus assembly ATPase PilB-like protein